MTRMQHQAALTSDACESVPGTPALGGELEFEFSVETVELLELRLEGEDAW